MVPKLDPEKYVKIFNFKLSVFWVYLELVERHKLEQYGYHNINLLYLDGQWFFDKWELKKYDFSDKKINKIIDAVEKTGQEFVDISSKYIDNLSSYSWEELMDLFEEVLESLNIYTRVLDMPVWCAYFFEGKVMKAMKDFGVSETDFDILLHPLFNSYHQRRHKEVIELKQGKISREDFKKKWAWSMMKVLQYEEVNDAFIEEQLSHVRDPKKELKGLETIHKKAEEEYKRVYNSLSEDLKKRADLIQRLVYARDYKYELLVRGCYNFHFLLEEVGKRLDLSYEDLLCLTPDEVRSKNISTDIEKRKKGFAFFEDTVYIENDFKEIKKLFEKESDATFVKGKGVSKGVIKGTAKIIHNAKELNKVEKNDIIVCEITTPDYMHALQKVSAIVANIGGFTSHSAIVAREFGIPCVVGTGNATNVFKDGDLIEVNADKGIVSLVNSKTS